MNNFSRFLTVFSVCLFLISPLAFAQAIQESEVFNSHLYLQKNTVRPAAVSVMAESLGPISGRYTIDEDTPIHETLPAISDMLNRDVEARSDASFESLRRNSIFSVETTLVSRFLGFITTRRSA